MSDKTFKNDDLLVDGLLNDDFRSFEKIYNKYSREIYLLCNGYLNDPSEAQDLVQEAFIYLWNNRSTLRPDSNLRAYLRRIIRNASLNALRNKRIRDKHKKTIDLESPSATTGPFDNPAFDGQDVQQEKSHDIFVQEEQEFQRKISYVNKKLGELPPGCKKAFIMSVIEGHTYQQVANQMGLSVNTIKTQIKIAYRKLRNNPSLG